MRIAICDDEKVQRALIIKYLQEWAAQRCEFLETVDFSCAENFLFTWEDDKQFDLLILDIEMGALSGMELARKIREENEDIPILFITGYETYMAQGYEVSAIQYLLKPMYKDKLFTALDKLKRGRKAEAKIPFQTDDGLLFLAPSDIWFLEAAGHYCILHTADTARQLRSSFTETFKILSPHKTFIHCHRSYVVNLKHVSAITRTDLVMDNHTKLPISRNSYQSVNQAFIRNYGLAHRFRSDVPGK